MSTLINFLERLNRKERYFVLAHATGTHDLVLGQHMRGQLSEKIGAEVPANARLFMDYHFDWLVVSLRLAFDQPARLFFKNTGKEVQGNQEDIDLLIAFEERTVTHLVMVEAKAATPWSRKQLSSKVHRLSFIFKSDEAWSSHVKPHFLLLSPRRPSDDVIGLLPGWATEKGIDPWIKLQYPPERLVVERTMANRRPARTGRHYLVYSEPKNLKPAA